MAELGLPESTTASARRQIRFPTIDVVRLLFPPFPVDGDGDGDGVDGRRGRLVFFLCAMGKGLLCSPWGFFFRVGAFVTGGGFLAGPSFRSASAGASFFSGCSVLQQLGVVVPLLLPSWGLPHVLGVC